MQDNAFLRNGSSIYEHNTRGYQTSYVHHIENPVRFEREIKVTIEHGHGNHLCNEMSSVAYWYADEPGAPRACPPVRQRLAVRRDNVTGDWVEDPAGQTASPSIHRSDEMRAVREEFNRHRT